MLAHVRTTGAVICSDNTAKSMLHEETHLCCHRSILHAVHAGQWHYCGEKAYVARHCFMYSYVEMWGCVYTYLRIHTHTHTQTERERAITRPPIHYQLFGVDNVLLGGNNSFNCWCCRESDRNRSSLLCLGHVHDIVTVATTYDLQGCVVIVVVSNN